MTTTRIVAADSSRARVLQVMDREQRLQEIEELLNPGGRLNDRELKQVAREAGKRLQHTRGNAVFMIPALGTGRYAMPGGPLHVTDVAA